MAARTTAALEQISTNFNLKGKKTAERQETKSAAHTELMHNIQDNITIDKPYGLRRSTREEEDILSRIAFAEAAGDQAGVRKLLAEKMRLDRERIAGWEVER